MMAFGAALCEAAKQLGDYNRPFQERLRNSG
jgi:hypothetical protein